MFSEILKVFGHLDYQHSTGNVRVSVGMEKRSATSTSQKQIGCDSNSYVDDGEYADSDSHSAYTISDSDSVYTISDSDDEINSARDWKSFKFSSRGGKANSSEGSDIHGSFSSNIAPVPSFGKTSRGISKRSKTTSYNGMTIKSNNAREQVRKQPVRRQPVQRQPVQRKPVQRQPVPRQYQGSGNLGRFMKTILLPLLLLLLAIAIVLMTKMVVICFGDIKIRII